MKAKTDRVSELKEAVVRHCAIDGHKEMVKEMITELSSEEEQVSLSIVDDCEQ
jgi:hypothetical protein